MKIFTNSITIIGFIVFIYISIITLLYIVLILCSIIGGTNAFRDFSEYQRRYFWECRKEVIVENVYPLPNIIVVEKTNSEDCEG